MRIYPRRADLSQAVPDKHVDSAGAADPVNIGREPEADANRGSDDDVANLRGLLGQNAVLLPIPTREKGPRNKGWQNTTLDRMSDPAYSTQLRAGNIGVLLGEASGGLCAIDIDENDEVQPFLAANPRLTATLRTRGARGAQVWIRMVGEYPKLAKLKTKEGDDWGEWRCDGGQSIIHGVHPNGMHYQRLVSEHPVEIAFSDINWPAHLKLPWVRDDFDMLVEADGMPFTVSDKGGVTLNQLFFVQKYLLEHRVLYDAGLGEFFEYGQSSGLWVRQTVESIKRALAADLTRTAKESGHASIYAKRTDGLLREALI